MLVLARILVFAIATIAILGVLEKASLRSLTPAEKQEVIETCSDQKKGDRVPKSLDAPHGVVSHNTIWLVCLARSEHDVILAASTLFIGLFTLGLWVSTFALWKASEQHSARQLRAYVFVTSGGFSGLSSKDENMSAWLTVENLGQTPAYGVYFFADFMVFDLPTPASTFELVPKDIDDDFLSISDLGPRDKTNKRLTDEKATISVEDRLAVKRGEKALYVWGIIEYTDAFKVKQTTEFRYWWHPKVSAREGHLSPTAKGNRAT